MRGIICDNCQTVLAFDGRNGESSTGEEAAWVAVEAAGDRFECCSRACATELLADDGPLRPAIDARLEVISEIARHVNGDDDSGADRV